MWDGRIETLRAWAKGAREASHVGYSELLEGAADRIEKAEAECKSLNTQARAAEQLVFEARAARDAIVAALKSRVCGNPVCLMCFWIREVLNANTPGWNGTLEFQGSTFRALKKDEEKK